MQLQLNQSKSIQTKRLLFTIFWLCLWFCACIFQPGCRATLYSEDRDSEKTQIDLSVCNGAGILGALDQAFGPPDNSHTGTARFVVKCKETVEVTHKMVMSYMESRYKGFDIQSKIVGNKIEATLSK